MAVALGIGCLLILLPFLPAMLWAGILVYCLWPLYLRLSRYIPSFDCGVLDSLVLAAIILVPLVHLALVAAREARGQSRLGPGCDAERLASGPADARPAMPLIGGVLTDFWNNSADDLGRCRKLTATGARPRSRIRAFNPAVQADAWADRPRTVALFITYFFFLTGAQVVSRIKYFLVRLMDESARRASAHADRRGRCAAWCLALSARRRCRASCTRSVLSFCTPPKALLLASLAGLVSIVPAGAVIVYVPLSLYLLATGHPLHAVVLLIYCFGVVGGAN